MRHSNTQKGDTKNTDEITRNRIYRQSGGTYVKKSIAVCVFKQILQPNRAKISVFIVTKNAVACVVKPKINNKPFGPSTAEKTPLTRPTVSGACNTEMKGDGMRTETRFNSAGQGLTAGT
jgi:hypothetical protein